MVTAALALGAIAGNAVPISIFYGVDVIFGSVATILAAVWFGRLAATVVGLAGGLVTVWLWGHGYALLIGAAEGLVVAHLYSRGWRNIVFADLVFWLAFGVPVILIGYMGLMGHSWDVVALIGLKQPLNGLFNALMAGLIVTGAQLVRDDRARRYMEARELTRVLFLVMLLVTLIAGAAPIIYGGYLSRFQDEQGLAKRLGAHAQDLAMRLTQRAYDASDGWQRLLASERTDGDLGLALLDGEGRVVASAGAIRERADATQTRRAAIEGLTHWSPQGIANPMDRWRDGRYRITLPVTGHERVARVAVEAPAAPLVRRIKTASAQRFGVLAAWFALALLITYVLSRELLRPISRLLSIASTTTNGVVITGADGGTEWVNDAFTRYAGYSLEEMTGRKPGHVLQGADTDPDTVKRIRESLAVGDGFRETLLNYAKDGTPYWIDITCSPLRDDNGSTNGFIAIQTDLTELKRVESQLRHERQRLSDILWGTRAGTWEWNVVTGERRFNERWAEIIGYRLAELEPTSIDTWLNATHPDDLARSNEALDRYFRGETPAYECEVRMRHRDGHWVWVLDRGRLVSRTDAGEPLWMYGTHLDITGRREAQDQADEIRARLQKLMAKVPGFVYQYQQWPDGTYCFPYASDGVRSTYGLEPETVQSSPSSLFERIHEEDYPRILEGIEASFSRLSTWHDAYRIVLPSGRITWLEGQAEPEAMPDGSVLWHGYMRDVTELHAYQEQLEAIAHYDSLTGLANRSLLADRMRKAMATASRHGTFITVVYLDLDGFKPINDTYGHETGDELLKAIAERLKQGLRATDTAARIGGDEFVVVLTDMASRLDAERTVDRILATIADPVAVSDVTVGVGASAGVTFYPQGDELEPEQLLRQADQAMYSAKRAGKQGYRLFSHTSGGGDLPQ